MLKYELLRCNHVFFLLEFQDVSVKPSKVSEETLAEGERSAGGELEDSNSKHFSESFQIIDARTLLHLESLNR